MLQPICSVEIHFLDFVFSIIQSTLKRRSNFINMELEIHGRPVILQFQCGKRIFQKYFLSNVFTFMSPSSRFYLIIILSGAFIQEFATFLFQFSSFRVGIRSSSFLQCVIRYMKILPCLRLNFKYFGKKYFFKIIIFSTRSDLKLFKDIEWLR